jgi:hypothetical protein
MLLSAGLAACHNPNAATGDMSPPASPTQSWQGGDIYVPGQYIAKLYSELLGRGPDAGEWTNAVEYFQSAGCSGATLSTFGTGVVESAEFQSLGYDAGALALVMYRAILNREPTAAEVSEASTLGASGSPSATLAAQLFQSSEFQQLSGTICTGKSYSFGTADNAPTAVPIPTTVSGGYGGLTEPQLQDLLNAAVPGTTVDLQQESLVYITAPLIIPNGVTLETYGRPDLAHHALMARLVRDAPFADAMIKLAYNAPTDSGALRNLWIDGGRNLNSSYVHDAIDIEVDGGSGVIIDSNFIGDSLGWSSLHSFGALDLGEPGCAGNSITGNLITDYPGTHYYGSDGGPTDGLSIGCENTVAQDNTIIDATDVGIVVFVATPAIQSSTIEGNTIIAAGNSAFGGITIDPLNRTATADFSGTVVSGNTLWTSPQQHFVIGISVGTLPWFYDGTIGTGATVTDNTTGALSINVAEAITVSGMLQATVEGNALQANPIPQSGILCPIDPGVVASVSAGFAGGSLQNYDDLTVIGCMGDNSGW